MRVMIVGYGFVGQATEYLLKDTDLEISVYDPDKGYYDDEGTFDYVFLCLPTNSNPVTDELDTTILEAAYSKWLFSGQIVIRSTIGPDQVERFPGAIIMPEFLRERHWKEDVDNPNLPLIVSDILLLSELSLILPRKKIHYLTPQEAAFFKIARNAALAIRVTVANEFYDICERYHIDYNEIKELLENDLVLGGTHWNVPGPDGSRGFGGKCLPKDLTHVTTLCYNDNNILKHALESNLVRRVLDCEPEQ